MYIGWYKPGYTSGWVYTSQVGIPQEGGYIPLRWVYLRVCNRCIYRVSLGVWREGGMLRIVSSCLWERGRHVAHSTPPSLRGLFPFHCWSITLPPCATLLSVAGFPLFCSFPRFTVGQELLPLSRFTVGQELSICVTVEVHPGHIQGLAS